MFGDEAPPVPPPPGHREIQQEELSRLFGRMAGARLVALPPFLGVALWLTWVEPAALAARAPRRDASAALVAFFVVEWVRWRRRGFTPGAVPRNLSVAIVGAHAACRSRRAASRPRSSTSRRSLGVISGVFVPWPLSGVLALVQVAAAWSFAAVGLSGALPDFNLAGVRGRRDACRVPRAWILTHATVLTFVYAFAAGAGRAVRWSFDRMVQRTAAAQQESLRAHAERAEELTALSGRDRPRAQEPAREREGARGAPRAAPPGRARRRSGSRVLRREVDRMQSVLDEFLNFSRPLVPLALGDVDVGALCREVAALHEGMARERSIEIAVRAGPVAGPLRSAQDEAGAHQPRAERARRVARGRARSSSRPSGSRAAARACGSSTAAAGVDARARGRGVLAGRDDQAGRAPGSASPSRARSRASTAATSRSRRGPAAAPSRRCSCPARGPGRRLAGAPVPRRGTA